MKTKLIIPFYFFLFLLLENPTYSRIYVSVYTPFNYEITNSSTDTSIASDWEIQTSLRETFWKNGLFLTTNNGTSWKAKNNHLKSQHVTALVKDETSSNLYLGTIDSGVFRSSDNGDSWETVSSGLNNLQIKTLAILGDNIYAGTAGGGLYWSSLSNIWWSGFNNGLPSSILTINSLISYYPYIYAGLNSNSIYRCSVSDSVWEQYYDGLPSGGAQIRALSVNSDNNFLLSITSGGLYKRDLNQGDWSLIRSATNYSSIATDGDEIYIGLTDDNLLKYSSNQGANWVDVRVGVDDLPIGVQSIAIAGNLLYVGLLEGNTTANHFFKRDDQSDWSQPELEHAFRYNGIIGAWYVELKTVKISIINVFGNDVFVGCYNPTDLDYNPNDPLQLSNPGKQYRSGEIYQSQNPDDPPATSPEFFKAYQCHGYAWHISEGGTLYPQIQADSAKRYIFDSSYIKVPDTTGKWYDKITYGYNPLNPNETMYHSAINYNGSKWISKLNVEGPLAIYNKLDDKMFDPNTTITFWTNKDTIPHPPNTNGVIVNGNYKIGKRLTSKGKILPDSNVSFRIAPLHKGCVELIPNPIDTIGFHAHSGSFFRAYIDGRRPEENYIYYSSPRILDSINFEVTKRQSDDINLTINSYPNPGNEIVNISIKSNDLYVDKKVNLRLFSYFGESIGKYSSEINKDFTLDLNEFSSGFYYLEVIATKNQYSKINEKRIVIPIQILR